MEWTAEADEYFKKVPPFVRPMAKRGVENYARTHGLSIITPEIIQKAKGQMEGKEKEIDKKAGNRSNAGDFDRKTARMHKADDGFLAQENVDPLRYAFKRKAVVHAGMTGTHLPDEQILPAWEGMVSQENHSRRRTVYLHIPFCRSHCRFCGFYMYDSKKEETAQYTEALIKEIKDNSQALAIQSHPVHAVYFGGGTPTALAPKDLQAILRALHDYLPLANDCEITIEGRVDDFSSEKMEACLAGGANRFSIGIQSFNSEVRQGMGRVAEREQVLKFLTQLCSYDQAAVIIDLIYGFPKQTMEIWQDDILTFLNETLVDGVDLYQLNVFRGGPLFKAIEDGRVAAAADIPTQAAMFAKGVEICIERRLRRLSLAHWARNARERNCYNSFTKFGSFSIPFGCGAGGRLPGYYFFQEGNLKNYYNLVAKGIKPVTTGMKLPDNMDLIREIVGNMEMLAVNLAGIGQKFNLDLLKIFAPLLTQWQKVGLIKLSKSGWLEFTIAGEFWNVTLAQKMVDFLENYMKENSN